MSNALLDNIQKIQTDSDSHGVLFEQALWELLKLYNENESCQFIHKLTINSGPLIRWEYFQKDFKQEVEKFAKRFTIAQLKKLLDNCSPEMDSFIRTYYRKKENWHFCCHRDICTLASFISEELKNKSKISNDSELQQLYNLALRKMHAFLYGMIAHNLITECYGYVPLELKDFDEDAEEHQRLSQNDYEW